jgi:hypothetical protein
MKLRISFLLLFLSTLTMAQVGVGTTSPNAQLDIQASNPISPASTDGILIPKIETFPAVDPGLSQQGMLVYLTTATVYKTVNKTLGFYYWDNVTANWIQIQTGNSNFDWTTKGNLGTNPSTNFIGTTDNTDIVFKRNNVRAGFIGNPDTTTGNRNTSFGANALNPLGTGTRNVAIGTNVLPVNTIGQLNVAIGDQAMARNTTGQTNIAIGVGALNENLSGISNVAIGRNSSVKINADFNTGVGLGTLRQNISGSYNVALGANAGYGVLGTNNIFVGAHAGYNETGSNKLYIHGSSSNALINTDSNAALIYGEFDNKILRVNGALQISNTTAERYSLPTNRGLAGQTLQTDGSGVTSWSSSTTKSFTTTGSATGIYTISPNEYTIRVYNNVSEVRLPSALLNPGKIFIIIGSNTISTKIFSSVDGGIYDDVATASITSLAANQRYMVQSDGTGWIVIGN